MKINILAVLLLMIAALFVINILYYANCTRPPNYMVECMDHQTMHLVSRPHPQNVRPLIASVNSPDKSDIQINEPKRSFKPNPLLQNKNFYDEKYWAYQEGLGEFGGKAEAFKFASLIHADDTLIDYGGGGGFLLNNLKAAHKILIEPNPHARRSAMKKFDLEAYASPEDVPESIMADIIISNHCLEHVPNPLEELTKLYQLLRKGGTMCIVVPVDAALGAKYSKSDINHHIYTWNALLLGNLVADAGFDVISSEEIQYMWPSDFSAVWDRLGEDGFLKAAHENAVRNKNYQVRLVAMKI